MDFINDLIEEREKAREKAMQIVKETQAAECRDRRLNIGLFLVTAGSITVAGSIGGLVAAGWLTCGFGFFYAASSIHVARQVIPPKPPASPPPPRKRGCDRATCADLDNAAHDAADGL